MNEQSRAASKTSKLRDFRIMDCRSHGTFQKIFPNRNVETEAHFVAFFEITYGSVISSFEAMVQIYRNTEM